MRLSQSQLTSFLRCERAWMLSYHRGLTTPRRSGALSLGSGYHKALEQHYNGEPVDVQANYAEQYAAASPAEKLDVLGEAKQVKAMFDQYTAWADARDAGEETLHTEHEMFVPVGVAAGEPIELHAIVDHVVRRPDGSVLLRDHKTSGRLDPPVPLEVSYQGKFYALAWWIEHPDAGPPAFEYSMSKKLKHSGTGAKAAKPPFFERHEAQYTGEQLLAHRAHILAVAERIVVARQRLAGGASHQAVTPPTPGDHCKYMCSFLPVCPVLDADPDRAEAMLTTDFVSRERPSSTPSTPQAA